MEIYVKRFLKEGYMGVAWGLPLRLASVLPLLRAHANPQLLLGDSMGRIEIFQSFVLRHANLLMQQCHLSRVLELEIIVVAKAYAARQARSWVAWCTSSGRFAVPCSFARLSLFAKA